MSQQISERVLDRKRHTVAFIVNGTQYTRLQTIRMAKKGEISGVRVCKGPQGPYLSSTTSVSLYSLPTRVSEKKTSRKAAAKKSSSRRSS